MNFALVIEQQNASLSLSGDLDRDSLNKDLWLLLSSKQQQSLKGVNALNVDLSEAPRADTAGLAWLINIIRDANKQNIKVIFTHVPTKLLNLADLSGAKHLLQAS